MSGSKVKFKKRGGRGLKVIDRQELKVKYWGLKVTGQGSKVKIKSQCTGNLSNIFALGQFSNHMF